MSYAGLAMKGAAVSAGALAVCTAAGGGFYLSGGVGYLWKRFMEWWYGVADAAVDGGKKVLIESLAFVQEALSAFGLGGLVAPVTSWLSSTIDGLAQWLKRTGALGTMLLAVFAGMLILRVRA